MINISYETINIIFYKNHKYLYDKIKLYEEIR
jgi:hypothetical protein